MNAIKPTAVSADHRTRGRGALFPNAVFWHSDGYFEIQVVGDQTYESVAAMGEAVKVQIAWLNRHGKPVRALDNLRRMGNVTREGRQLVIDLGKELDYEKLAMVGRGRFIRLGANMIFKAIGKGAKLRYFDDYAAAAAWLRR